MLACSRVKPPDVLAAGGGPAGGVSGTGSSFPPGGSLWQPPQSKTQGELRLATGPSAKWRWQWQGCSGWLVGKSKFADCARQANGGVHAAARLSRGSGDAPLEVPRALRVPACDTGAASAVSSFHPQQLRNGLGQSILTFRHVPGGRGRLSQHARSAAGVSADFLSPPHASGLTRVSCVYSRALK